MKVSKKTIVVLIFIILSLLAVIYIIAVRQSTSPETITTPSQQIPSQLTIDNLEKITIDIDQSELDLPNSASLLNISPLPPINEDRINTTAANLNYDTEPLIVEDQVLGTIYVFNSATDSLSINPQSNSISFGSTQPMTAINKQLSDEELISEGLDFLANNLEVDTNDLEFIGFSYYEVPETGEKRLLTTKDNADYYQLNFSPVVNDLIILTLNPELTTYYVQILPDGRIHKAGVQEIGKLTKSEDSFKLKNVDEINNSLEQAKLVSLGQGNINIPDINSQYLKSITITEIELAYLYLSPDDKVLQPIYILKGTANIIESQGEVEVVLYMPAISQS